MKKLLLLLLVIWMAVLPVMAQDALPADCTADALTTLADSLQKAHDDAMTALKAGDMKAAMEALTSVQGETAALEATCAGLSWTGKAAKVIGPVELAEGVYRATAKTTGPIFVNVTPTKGECGVGSSGFFMPNLFLLMPGSASDGSEAILTSSGCTALLEVAQVTAEWSLTLEKVG